MHYVIEAYGKKKPVSNLVELNDYLEDVRNGKLIDVTLSQEIGERKGFEKFFYKALGANQTIKGESVYVLTQNSDLSAVVFLDPDFNEYRVINEEAEKLPVTQIEFSLESGEKSIHASDECVSTDLAIQAVQEFFKTGNRPTWLKYRKVPD